jgi:hypothetical protein
VSFAARVTASNPGKRAAEHHFLRFTLVWGPLAGLVMVSGWAERWSDGAALAFGGLMGAGAVAVPMLRPTAEERAQPWARRAGVKLSLSVVLFALLYNYFQTPFFFEVLHMHYGFPSTLNLDSNPIFLYLLTVAYFATYCALVNAAFRLAARSLRGPLRVLGMAAAPFAVAFLESALNANPFTRALFCFDDMALMLSFGTFCYGIALALCLAVWIRIDEQPGEDVAPWRMVGWVVLAVALDTGALWALQHSVAPQLTRVEAGARGLRDFEGSCLVAPGQT